MKFKISILWMTLFKTWKVMLQTGKNNLNTYIQQWLIFRIKRATSQLENTDNLHFFKTGKRPNQALHKSEVYDQ